MDELDLDSRVRSELEKRRGDWKHLAAEAGVSHSWISQFVREKIPNPGYSTLRKLCRCMGVQAEHAATASKAVA